MGYTQRAVTLSDFRLVDDTDNNLLAVRFADGQTIFVHHTGFDEFTHEPNWVMHEDFCPSELLRARAPGHAIRKNRQYEVPDRVSATVGKHAEFTVNSTLYFRSRTLVVEIAPAAYRDAFHDDLNLAEPIII